MSREDRKGNMTEWKLNEKEGTCYKKEAYYFDSLGEFWNCL